MLVLDDGGAPYPAQKHTIKAMVPGLAIIRKRRLWITQPLISKFWRTKWLDFCWRYSCVASQWQPGAVTTVEVVRTTSSRYQVLAAMLVVPVVLEAWSLNHRRLLARHRVTIGQV
jgi:hypothetical protein